MKENTIHAATIQIRLAECADRYGIDFKRANSLEWNWVRGMREKEKERDWEREREREREKKEKIEKGRRWYLLIWGGWWLNRTERSGGRRKKEGGRRKERGWRIVTGNSHHGNRYAIAWQSRRGPYPRVFGTRSSGDSRCARRVPPPPNRSDRRSLIRSLRTPSATHYPTTPPTHRRHRSPVRVW